MKNIIKKYICLFAVIFIIITGCQQSNNYNFNEAQGNSEKIKIKFMHDSTEAANEIEKLIREYNNTNEDNIDVEIVQMPLNKEDEVFSMQMASGDGPDVYSVDIKKVLSYYEQNWIADLSMYVDNDYLDRFPKKVIDIANNAVFQGKFFTIPSIVDTYRLIYNKDLFKKAGLDPEVPPKTLADMREYAKKITEYGKTSKKYGFVLPVGDSWSGFVLSMEIPATYSGLSIFNFKKGKYDISVLKPWLQAYLDMKNDGSLFPGDISLKLDVARAQFAEGNIGMIFAGSFDPFVYSNQFPVKFELGVAMPPAVNKESIGKGALCSVYSFSWGVNPLTKNMDAAVTFWKFLYSDNFLGELYKTGKALPIVNGITDNENNRPNIENLDKFLPGSQDSVYPNSPLIINEEERFKTYASILFDQKQIDKSIEELNERFNNQLNILIANGKINIENYKINDYDTKNPLK